MLLEWGNQHHNPVCLPGRGFFPHGSGHLTGAPHCQRQGPWRCPGAMEVSRGNVAGMRHTQVSTALSLQPPAPSVAELPPNMQALHGRSALTALQKARMSWWLCFLPGLRAPATKPHRSAATCEPFPSRGRCQQGWFIPTIRLWINTSRRASICCGMAPCSG